MRRRQFITLLGGATAWPVVVRAQQPAAMPVIGFLTNEERSPYLAAFQRGLGEVGLFVGQNVAVDARAAGGNFERFPDLAAELWRGRAATPPDSPCSNTASVASGWSCSRTSHRASREQQSCGMSPSLPGADSWAQSSQPPRSWAWNCVRSGCATPARSSAASPISRADRMAV